MTKIIKQRHNKWDINFCSTRYYVQTFKERRSLLNLLSRQTFKVQPITKHDKKLEFQNICSCIWKWK